MPGSCGARARDPAATRPLLSREEGCLRPDPSGRATVWDSAAEHALRCPQYLAGALAPASGVQSATGSRAPVLARGVTRLRQIRVPLPCEDGRLPLKCDPSLAEAGVRLR